MVSVNNLSIHFGGRYLFDNVSFNINPKDRIGLIGRNGTGKSTLLKILSGLEQQENGIVSKPRDFEIGYLPQEGIIISKKNIYDETKSALKNILDIDTTIKKLIHEIENRTDYNSKEYLNLIHELDEANQHFKIAGGMNLDEEIEKILTGLGFLREEFYRPVNEFSGGWQMRIELAKILLRNPNLILLDEPTNHLDIESIEWLENYLRNYNGSIMLVSHDRNFLNAVTDRTIEIANFKIYDLPVSYNEFLVLRQEQKDQLLSAFKSQQKQIEQTEKFIERFRSKATLATRVQSRIKQLDKVERIEIEDEDTSAIGIKFPEPPRSGRMVAEAIDLSKSYGDKSVLKNIVFDIERGDKIAFVGKNGEGKSTFSRILAGKEEFDGTLNFGFNVEIGYFAQHQAELLDGDDTVFDVIDRAATGDMRTKVRSLLGAFLFSGDAVYKKVKVLSGGEKSRLALAKLMLQPINFLILDEPTNHLDMAAKDVLKKALLDYKGALIIVSHDRDFLNDLTTKTYYFGGGNIKEYIGDIYYFLNKYKVESLKELELKTPVKNYEETKNIQSQAQQSRQQQKDIQREENKIKKSISGLEIEIEQLEKQIELLDNEFQNPELYNNIAGMQLKKSKYDELRSNLDKKMEEWSNLSEELEKVKTKY